MNNLDAGRPSEFHFQFKLVSDVHVKVSTDVKVAIIQHVCMTHPTTKMQDEERNTVTKTKNKL